MAINPPRIVESGRPARPEGMRESSPRGPSMTTLNISLPDALLTFVREQAARGGFATPGDFVRDVLNDLRRREAKRRVEALLLEGLHEGARISWSTNDSGRSSAARSTRSSPRSPASEPDDHHQAPGSARPGRSCQVPEPVTTADGPPVRRRRRAPLRTTRAQAGDRCAIPGREPGAPRAPGKRPVLPGGGAGPPTIHRGAVAAFR
jgi:antitoxin ParD1/3/4